MTVERKVNIMKDLILIGASGYGREIYDMIERLNKDVKAYNVLGFIDDNKDIWGTEINTVKVLGGSEYVKKHFVNKSVCAVITIASASVKRKMVEELDGYVEWETLIDPTAIVSNYCHIGKGSLIGAFSQVGPNATIGEFCSILYACSVGHDAILEDYVSAMDYCDITGYDYLEEGVYLGSSVAILPNLRICKNAVIGGGAVVVKDLLEQGTYTGVPAKLMKG